jgi:50S ribosomal protein L16 3-hydroxylase
MLYLPPRYGHDGIADGECQTCSIGFRAPGRGELARELLERLADDAADVAGGALYADRAQPAVAEAGRIPADLRLFAADALQRALRDPLAIDRALGESLSEPKANVWFDAAPAPRHLKGVVLDRRTRMLYDDRHVFVNGESWRAAGADARLMRRLADRRRLEAAEVEGASAGARELLVAWCEAGWAHGGDTT